MNSIKPELKSTVRAEILDHISRYRIGVLESVQRLPLLRVKGLHAVKRAINELVRHGDLGVALLFRNRRYFFLTDQAAPTLAHTETINPDDLATGPLSELAKIRAYATLAFCCLKDSARERLTRTDFQKHFPDLYQPGMAMNYYIDKTGGTPRLGFLRIDTGGHGRWDRIVAKCRDDIEEHRLRPGFMQFTRLGAFELTVVTALPQKAERIRQTLAETRAPPSMNIRVCAIPELLNLIAPPPC